MSTFANEIIEKIDSMKKLISDGKELQQKDMEILFLAALLEEEGNDRS